MYVADSGVAPPLLQCRIYGGPSQTALLPQASPHPGEGALSASCLSDGLSETFDAEGANQTSMGLKILT